MLGFVLSFNPELGYPISGLIEAITTPLQASVELSRSRSLQAVRMRWSVGAPRCSLTTVADACSQCRQLPSQKLVTCRSPGLVRGPTRVKVNVRSQIRKTHHQDWSKVFDDV